MKVRTSVMVVRVGQLLVSSILDVCLKLKGIFVSILIMNLTIVKQPKSTN